MQTVRNLMRRFGLWLVSRGGNDRITEIQHQLDGCMSRTDKGDAAITKRATYMGHLTTSVDDFTTVENTIDELRIVKNDGIA